MSIGVEESGSSASGGFVGGVGLLVVAPLDVDVVIVVLLVGGGVVLLGGVVVVLLVDGGVVLLVGGVVVLLVGGGVVLLGGVGVVLLGGGGIGGGVESLGMIRPPRKLFITSANFLGKSRDAGFESRL